MAGIQAPWVGKTPEEWHEKTTGEKEYSFTFTLKGSISVYAKDLENAFEKAGEMSSLDLLDYVDDVEFEEE